MRGRVRVGFAATVVAVLSLLAVGGPSADSGAARVVRLAAGDQVVVAASSVRCTVSSVGGGPPTIVCGEGDAAGARPGSFSFAVADDTLQVMRASKASLPIEVARRTQPPIVGAAYPGKMNGGRSLTVRPGAAMTVTGTHVLCAVANVSAQPYVTCGVADGAGAYAAGSFVGVVSDTQLLVVRKLARNGSKTVLTRIQPAP
jgi:hypothetical protein